MGDKGNSFTKISELRQWSDSHKPLEPYLWIFYIMIFVLILVVLAFFILSFGEPKNNDSDSDSSDSSDSEESDCQSEDEGLNINKIIPKTLQDKK